MNKVMLNVFTIMLTLTFFQASLFSDISGADNIKSELINIYKLTIDPNNLESIHEIAAVCLEDAKALKGDKMPESKLKDIEILISGIEEIIEESDLELIKNKSDELIKLIRN